MIIPLFPHRKLADLRLRVVKRWRVELVLTNGRTLELWEECRPARGLLGFEGKSYRYVRPLQARELFWEPSSN
jgi:hypothetical protein